jgi:hypothetical protein
MKVKKRSQCNKRFTIVNYDCRGISKTKKNTQKLAHSTTAHTTTTVNYDRKSC